MYGLHAANILSHFQQNLARTTLNLLLKQKGKLGPMSELTVELNHLINI
jgi:hypothetical protein